LTDAIHFQFRTAFVSDLEATFAAPDFYAKPRSEILELETQLKTARDKVAHLYARWHELELLQSVPSS
jgi:ATP-binding cassette subfamily F protein uup